VGNLEADLGGTEMEDALVSTFGLAQSVSGDLLLITDGDISSIEDAVKVARESGHRIFAVGIGSSPSEGLLHRMAEETGGACDFVAPGEAVEPAVLRMFARLRSPRLSDLRLEWPDGTQALWTTALPLSVFSGDTVNVYAGFARKPNGAVRLHGRPAGQAHLVEVGVLPWPQSCRTAIACRASPPLRASTPLP
jgi:Ca-activated chloride channel family protein